MKPILLLSTLLAIATAFNAGCTRKMYNPAWATPPYPRQLHTTQTRDMQVFRRDTDVEIVNASPYSYADFNLWINQRFMRPVKSLQAGENITLSLWDFYDEFGQRFNAGGFFRLYPATPVRLVEIQTSEEQAMVGLITIRREDVAVGPDRR